MQAVLESMPGVQRDSTFHDADMPGYSGHHATFSCAKRDASSVLRRLETVAEQLWAWIAREDVDKRADAARIVDVARAAKKLRRDQAAAERAARVKEKTRRSLSETQVRLALEASNRSPGRPGESPIESLKFLESLEPPSAAPVAASALLRFLEALRQEVTNQATAVRMTSFFRWLPRNVSRQETAASMVGLRTASETAETVAALGRHVQRLQERVAAQGRVPHFAMPVWRPSLDAALPWLEVLHVAMTDATRVPAGAV